jgi:hypothetical protein
LQLFLTKVTLFLMKGIGTNMALLQPYFTVAIDQFSSSVQTVGVFSLARYRVVKITRSYSEVVLRTTKHTIIYPGSDPSLKVIALCPAV